MIATDIRAAAPAPLRDAVPAPLCFMSVRTQFDNLGDALIVRELAQAVGARAPLCVDLSRCPAGFERTLGLDQLPEVRVLRRFGYSRLIGAILRERLRGRRCRLFLMPGGLGGVLRARRLIGMAAINLLLSLLSLAGVRAALVGISVEPFGPRERPLWRWRAAALRTLWVRDRSSADTLAANGITVDAICPDMSFGLDGEPAPAPADIAVSFRFDRGDAAGAAAIRAFVDRLIAAESADRHFRFIAQVGRDVAPMSALYEHARGRIGARASLHLVTDDLAACMAAHAGCKAIYSNRLHALLVAAQVGAAPCAVLTRGATNKFAGIFADLGIADQIHWLNEDDTRLRAPPAPVDRARLRAEADRLNGMFDALLGPAVRT